MARKQENIRLTEHVEYVRREATVNLSLLQVAQTVHQD